MIQHYCASDFIIYCKSEFYVVYFLLVFLNLPIRCHLHSIQGRGRGLEMLQG